MDDATEFLRRSMPFCDTLAMRAVALTREQVAVELDWADRLCTSSGLLHGGVIMALADAAGGACAFLNLPDGAVATSTIESKTNFLRGVAGGTITATAAPLHVGSMTIVIETSVHDTSGRIVAKVTQSQAVLRSR